MSLTKPLPVRFHDEDESLDVIVSAARERPFDGVLAVGDRPAVLAARAAQALKLPGNSPEAVLAASSKFGSRERFAAAGLTTPWFLAVPEHARAPSSRRMRACAIPASSSRRAFQAAAVSFEPTVRNSAPRR